MDKKEICKELQDMLDSMYRKLELKTREIKWIQEQIGDHTIFKHKEMYQLIIEEHIAKKEEKLLEECFRDIEDRLVEILNSIESWGE